MLLNFDLGWRFNYFDDWFVLSESFYELYMKYFREFIQSFH